MKKITHLLILFSLALLLGCKKDHVDSSDAMSFQSSINDMTSSLNTLQQTKFNEALYILKTFGVEADGETNEMVALRKMLNGKKVPEIFSMADEVAQKNAINWSSTGPPSLGEMNIFEDVKAKESDPNEVSASSLSVLTKPISVDSLLGPKALQIIPRLVDASGVPINFSGATLETTLEVFSNGIRLISSKNLMQDNNFGGFTLKFASLPAQKIVDNKIDISVSVKTTKKTYKMTKVGVPINPKFLQQTPTEVPITNTEGTSVENNTETNNPNSTSSTETTTNTTSHTEVPKVTSDPKTIVQKFLNNLASQNLKGAYENSSNPNWGSYDNFSNPTSGFGSVKSISVKNVTPSSVSANTANVNATYDVTDKTGKTTPLKVTFGLKNINGEWKISSYKIN